MSGDQELLRAVALEVALGCGILEAALLAGGFEGAPMVRDLAQAGSAGLMLAGSDALLERLRISRGEGRLDDLPLFAEGLGTDDPLKGIVTGKGRIGE